MMYWKYPVGLQRLIQGGGKLNTVLLAPVSYKMHLYILISLLCFFFSNERSVTAVEDWYTRMGADVDCSGQAHGSVPTGTSMGVCVHKCVPHMLTGNQNGYLLI